MGTILKKGIKSVTIEQIIKHNYVVSNLGQQ